MLPIPAYAGLSTRSSLARAALGSSRDDKQIRVKEPIGARLAACRKGYT